MEPEIDRTEELAIISDLARLRIVSEILACCDRCEERQEACRILASWRKRLEARATEVMLGYKDP